MSNSPNGVNFRFRKTDFRGAFQDAEADVDPFQLVHITLPPARPCALQQSTWSGRAAALPALARGPLLCGRPVLGGLALGLCDTTSLLVNFSPVQPALAARADLRPLEPWDPLVAAARARYPDPLYFLDFGDPHGLHYV